VSSREFNEALRDIRNLTMLNRKAMFTPPAAPLYYVCLCGECGNPFSSQIKSDKQCRQCRHTEAAMHGPMERT
jgi:hypothetical protein